MKFETKRLGEHEIYSFSFQKEHWLALAFIRIQEFYESPDKLVRGANCTLEDLIDRELGEKGEWTYLEDWGGFNVPGHVWDHFFAKCPDVRDKEKVLQAALAALEPGPLFYVIGTSTDDTKAEATLQHEIRHALWYLYDDYRKPMLRLMERFKTRGLRTTLLKLGYDESVLDDEVQAYVLTGFEKGMRSTGQIRNLRRELRKIEKKFWPQVQ